MSTERMDAIENRLDKIEAIAKANVKAVANHQAIINELREGQALLTQFLVEQREQNAEFRRTTNATLDRMERIQREQAETLAAQGRRMEEQNRRIDEQGQRIDNQGRRIDALQQQTKELRQDFLAMDGRILELQQQIKELRQDFLTAIQQFQKKANGDLGNGGNSE